MDGNWASGDWNIAHNPDAWELMFDALPARQPRARMGAVPPARLSHRSDARRSANGRPKFFHVHGKDATVRWDVVREHGVFGKYPFVQMRTPGFGDTDWTRVISELRLAGYAGTHRHRRLARSGLSRRARDDRPGAGARLSQALPGRRERSSPTRPEAVDRLPGAVNAPADQRRRAESKREDRHEA